MDDKILERFEKFEKIIENNDLKLKLKEAEVRGGLKAANWIAYLVYGLLTTGLGGALLKIWQLSQHVV